MKHMACFQFGSVLVVSQKCTCGALHNFFTLINHLNKLLGTMEFQDIMKNTWSLDFCQGHNEIWGMLHLWKSSACKVVVWNTVTEGCSCLRTAHTTIGQDSSRLFEHGELTHGVVRKQMGHMLFLSC